MNIAIVGYGDQGRSALEYWNIASNKLTVCDRNAVVAVPDGIETQLGPEYLRDLDRFDLIVRSPGVHPDTIVAAADKHILSKVTTVTNEFFRVCPTANIIGVTGTKGKGTTSTMIARMLEAGGHRVHLGGNIGVPPLDLLKNDIKPEDWVVLELANFQLIDLRYSPPLAVCLMVVPEHLNWHADMAEYLRAKQQLFRWQQPENVAIFFAGNENSRNVAAVSPGKKIPYFSLPGAVVEAGSIIIDGHKICETSELKLLGRHNWQNICAAVTAVWQVMQDTSAIRHVLTTFSGLEHRLEFVREVNGVKYYDDSFGTTPETAIVAIEAFEEPKVLILGGSDKQSHYEALARTIARNQTTVRQILLIGETAGKIRDALEAEHIRNIVPGGATMHDIVETAQAVAQPGDIVLLSTGCASFDMFENYKDRGNKFKAEVAKLA